jgi:hypothetical protein
VGVTGVHHHTQLLHPFLKYGLIFKMALSLKKVFNMKREKNKQLKERNLDHEENG